MTMMTLSQTAFLASVQICVCLRAMFMMISMMMTAAVVCGIAVDVVDITGVFRYCLFTSMLLLVVRLHTMRSRVVDNFTDDFTVTFTLQPVGWGCYVTSPPKSPEFVT